MSPATCRAAAVFVAIAEAAERYGVFFPEGADWLRLSDVDGKRIASIEVNDDEELELFIDHRVIPFDEAKRLAAQAEPVAMAKGVARA